jgi:hypothetical protein
MVRGILFGVAAVAVLVASASAAGPSSIVSFGKSWRCSGPVNLASVTVTIGAADAAEDGVFLGAGCTGQIASITVDEWRGDGIVVGAGAHDLQIGNITVHCYAHDSGKHQDGVQVMGGRKIRFNGGYIGCYSANDSQATIHEGVGNNELPTNVIFDRLTADPAGVQDPTGHPLYHYGTGGAYGIANGQSARSGFTNLTLLSLANRHDLFQGDAVTNPVWSFIYLPPGVRKSPGIP